MFDQFIMIDWSSKSGLSPKKSSGNAVWMGVAGLTGDIETDYFRSRAACVDKVRKLLTKAADQRILVGFDFPYGYPRGLASALGLNGPAKWRSVWDELTRRITDDDENRNNRFLVAEDLNQILTPQGNPYGPFWGRPATRVLAALHESCRYPSPFETRAGGHLKARRRTEAALPGTQSAWKLYTPGSVGGQVLVGIPCVARLHDAFPARSKVWPFETGFTASPCDSSACVLHAEIWPGVIEGQYPLLVASRERDRLRSRLSKKRRLLTAKELSLARQRVAELDRQVGDFVTDQLQVRFLCEWARSKNAGGALARMFAAPRLTQQELTACVAEEGWILGAH
jgi:hypothetical protein